jgi:hypothetical protein
VRGFLKAPLPNLFLGVGAVSKDLRKELADTAKAFKHEPDETKKRARELYKVAIKAMDKIDYMQKEIEAYKSPRLTDPKERPDTEARKEKRFWSATDRLRWFLDNAPESPGCKRHLELMNLTLIQAKELLDKEKETR